MNKRFQKMVWVCGVSAVLGGGTQVLAQAKAAQPAVKDDHGHDHAEVVLPKTFAECLLKLRSTLRAVEASLGKGDMHMAHEEAYGLSEIAKTVGKLALAKDSGVPRDKVREANVTGKDLSKAASDLHDVAAEGKKDESAKLLAQCRTLIEKLENLTGVKYICDMHCEGTKTYDAPGTCPVCKMAFVKLSEAPFSASVKSAAAITPGQPAELAITLRRPNGEVVKEVDTVHDHKLHFMIVSEDLSFYAHEHPAQQADGTFKLPGVKLPFGGRYVTFSDFTPKGFGNQVASFEFKVAGDGPKPQTLKEDYDIVGKIDGYEFRVRCNGQKFFANEHSIIRIGIDKDGKSVEDLEKLMGEFGHLVIISSDLKSYVHSHPISLDEKKDDHGHAHDDHGHDHAHHMTPDVEEAAKKFALQNGKPSDVVFHAVFPKPGMYRAFAQFQHKGKVLTFPFNIDAQVSEGGKAAPTDGKDAGHDHSGHGDKK